MITQDGDTALHLAAREGHTAMVDLLLLKGAQVDSRNDVSSNVCTLCRSKNDKPRLKLVEPRLVLV